MQAARQVNADLQVLSDESGELLDSCEEDRAKDVNGDALARCDRMRRNEVLFLYFYRFWA